MSTKKLQKTQGALQQKYNRTFSESFKKSKVKEIVENRLSVRQVCELYNISRTSVYKWVYRYSSLEKGTKQVVQMESESLKTNRLLEQVAELERIIGQKQLQVDLLNKTLEIASAEIGYDIKKKYAPKSLSTIVKTESDTTTK